METRSDEDCGGDVRGEGGGTVGLWGKIGSGRRTVDFFYFPFFLKSNLEFQIFFFELGKR